MTDKKFTDEEVIKALECCAKPYCNNNNCPLHENTINTKDCITKLSENALALINRQKVEIESLKIANEKMYDACKKQEAEIERLKNNPTLPKSGFINLLCGALIFTETLEQYNKFRRTFKSEAVKEFAERLKKRLERKYTIYGREYVLRHLRELVKEMTEERTE